MKTKHENYNLQRTRHHAALETLRSPDCHQSGLQLWRKLRRIEARTHRAAKLYCNGEIEESDWNTAQAQAVDDLRDVFGWLPSGIFINGDPRGCALKLDGERCKSPSAW